MNRAPRLSRPIVVEERSDGKFVVATHRGEVWTITEDGIGKKKMLDVGGELAAFGDSGLIGMALHPQFDAPTNPTGWVYLWYVTPHVQGNKAPAFSRLVRYTAKFPMFEEIDESSRLDSVIADMAEVTLSANISHSGSYHCLWLTRLMHNDHYHDVSEWHTCSPRCLIPRTFLPHVSTALAFDSLVGRAGAVPSMSCLRHLVATDQVR